MITSNHLIKNSVLTNEDSQLLSSNASGIETELLNSPQTQKALDNALNLLLNGDFQQRWDVSKVFSQLGKVAIYPLQKICLDESEELEARWFALKILGNFQDVEVIFTLISLLETTEEEELINLASETFAKQGKRAIKPLSSLLKSPSHKFLATKALAQIQSVEIVEPLLLMVKDENADIRVICIEALSKFQDLRILDVLRSSLKDHSSKVRKEALINLSLKIKSSKDLKVTFEIANLLYDVNIEVCQQAAIALSRIKTEMAIDLLFEVLRKENTPIPLRITTIKCLGWIETQSSLEYLDKALFLVDKDSIIEIIKVLGRINQENLKDQAVEILVNFYYSSHSLIKDNLVLKNLAYTWKQLGNVKSKIPLQELQKTDDLTIKIYATSALRSIETL